jgi:4-oxalocrotonate tautomerase
MRLHAGARNYGCRLDEGRMAKAGHLCGMARNRDDGLDMGWDARQTLCQPRRRLIESGEECEMPFINVKVIEGVFTAEQKREIAERLSETMIDIEGESMRDVTMVVIDETKSEDWAIGGRCMSAEDVRALAAQSTDAKS